MRITLGVTGSIAAYKACELVRLFVKSGDEVRVIMTPAAEKFVTPLTFQTLSRNPVGRGLFDEPQEWMPEHISYADADAVVVAPATADIIAKLACGIADDLLSSVLLATRSRIFVAPAMNSGMWESPATRANIETIRARGIEVIGPGSGDLACGTSGDGRMAPIEEIFAAARQET